MELTSGKSHDNGIDFYVKNGKERYIVSARRNNFYEIEVSIETNSTKQKENKLRRVIVSAVLAVIFTTIFSLLEKMESNFIRNIIYLLPLVGLWIAIIVFSYSERKNPDNDAVSRYHSAEHKVLNYYDVYLKLPKTIEDIEKESNIYLGCGCTFLTVILLFISCITLSIVLVPTIFLKILCALISSVFVFFFWVAGKCNFLQKFYLQEPTYTELELAIYAMNKLSEFERM